MDTATAPTIKPFDIDFEAATERIRELNEKVLAAAKQLESQGLLTAPIRPPTVPAGQSRLRLALSAAHREEDVAQLGEALASL